MLIKSTKIPILLYHRIVDEKAEDFDPFCVSIKKFKKQIMYLYSNGFQTINLNQVINYIKNNTSIPKKPVIITFDDGRKDNFTNVFPILKFYGFTATIFLISDYMQNNKKSTYNKKSDYLSWDNVYEMKEYGISFQSHGCSHTPLTKLSIDEANEEIYSSKFLLEDKLNNTINFFAYPYGEYNTKLKNLVAQNGYMGACGGIPKLNGVIEDYFEIGRTEIFNKDSLRMFAFKVRTGYNYYYYILKNLGHIRAKVIGCLKK